MKANPSYFGDFRRRVYTKYRVKKEEMYEHPERYLCLSKISRFRVIDYYKREEPVNVIYSQWRGYLDIPEHQKFGAKQVAAYRGDPMVNFTYAHSSGHAPVEDLQKFARAINPKMLIPIHTEYAGTFGEFFDNVKVIGDQQVVSLGDT